MTKSRLRVGAAWLVLGMSGFASGCAEDDAGSEFEATIRWTSFGIPHITADDIPSAAFGQGWAFAKLNGCILADQIVKVRSERASFFGPGDGGANVDSDFAHLALDIYARAEAGYDEQPDEIKGMLRGYVAGYNAYITEHGDDLPCGGEPWLRPITAVDLMAHYVELGTLASSRQFHEFIVTASPPGSPLHRDPKGSIADIRRNRPGSNGWAIGRDRSVSGGGMVVGNPHFPWEGELKLYESHLTVPDELDVYGASLMGVVGVLIGFNEAVAWTHTVSDGQRFTMYKLQLDPADPTRYLYDGEYRAMESRELTIDVLQDDGSLQPRSRTLWYSHYGPILNVSPFGWSADLVLTARDANIDNTVLIQQFAGMNQAEDLDEFQRVHAEVQGIPWVNTMAASADGRAWYADTTPTPNLSQAALAAWAEAAENDFLTSALAANDVVLLDGGDSLFEWVEEPGARSPGLVPYDRVPKLERTDFVFNANDSHWLSNPAQPLTGYSPLHGFEQTPRTPRTRMNAVVLTEMGEGTASGADGKFDLQELRTAILNNRGMMAELLRDEVVARCQGAGPVPYDGQMVDITAACNALAGWDLRLDLDSPGALAWREFLGDFDAATLLDAGVLFDEPFDAAAPIDTPRGLAPPDGTGDDRILEALAGAVVRLQQAGLTPATTLRDAQFTRRASEVIPIHGGGRNEGVTNLIVHSELRTTLDPGIERGEVLNDATDLTTEGYVVNYGSSFVMVMGFSDDGPQGSAFITYGQSNDPTSEHFVDQTRRFSEKNWRDILFTPAAIEADPELEIEDVAGEYLQPE